VSSAAEKCARRFCENRRKQRARYPRGKYKIPENAKIQRIVLYSAKLLCYAQHKSGKGAADMTKRSFANEYFYAYAGFAFYFGKAYTCIAAKPG
jgi:hypothetical protein